METTAQVEVFNDKSTNLWSLKGFLCQWEVSDKRQDLNRLLVLLFFLSFSSFQCWKSLGSPFRADDKHLTTETNVASLTPLQRRDRLQTDRRASGRKFSSVLPHYNSCFNFGIFQSGAPLRPRWKIHFPLFLLFRHICRNVKYSASPRVRRIQEV